MPYHQQMLFHNAEPLPSDLLESILVLKAIIREIEDRKNQLEDSLAQELAYSDGLLSDIYLREDIINELQARIQILSSLQIITLQWLHYMFHELRQQRAINHQMFTRNRALVAMNSQLVATNYQLPPGNSLLLATNSQLLATNSQLLA